MLEKIEFYLKYIFIFAISGLSAFSINYLTGIISVVQYKIAPWNTDHTQYQFFKYLIGLYQGTINRNLHFRNELFNMHMISLAIATCIVLIGLLAVYLYLKSTFFANSSNSNNSNSSKNTHGNARFAIKKEVEQAGLFPQTHIKPSIILGKFNNQYLEFNQTKFVALAAPTRAGKGVGIVIPNLLHWHSSVVCLDIKGENFEKTSGYRAKFSKVFKFDPFSLHTHAYNPLTYISRDGISTISDIQSIARILWPINDSDPIWHDSACNLFQGLVLFLLNEELYIKETKVNFEKVLNLANQIGILNLDGWKHICNNAPFPKDKNTINSLNAYFNLPQETRTSVLGTFNAQMQIFANPTVAAATSKDDFDLRNIRKEKMSIYVCVAPNRLSQASKILNIFFSQLIQVNTEELPEQNAKLKETGLILLDEFTAIGKVEIIEKSISYIAGYGLRLLLIYQSQSQLSAVYGEESARNIVTNCGCQILFAPREQRDAEEYSKMLGNTTINTQNYSYNQGGKDQSGKNISINQQERALMLPQELKEMGVDTSIIIIEDCKPIKAQKIKYFEDSNFASRLLDKIMVNRLIISNSYQNKILENNINIENIKKQSNSNQKNILQDLGWQ